MPARRNRTRITSLSFPLTALSAEAEQVADTLKSVRETSGRGLALADPRLPVIDARRASCRPRHSANRLTQARFAAIRRRSAEFTSVLRPRDDDASDTFETRNTGCRERLCKRLWVPDCPEQLIFRQFKVIVGRAILQLRIRRSATLGLDWLLWHTNLPCGICRTD